jgi:glutathione synthase/RimK-type ligase-like ATP-grasp enzyme
MPVYGENGVYPSCREYSPFVPFKNIDFVLFWDKDIRLARAFEAAGLPVFNSASAIEACDDKALTLERLSGNGLIGDGKQKLRLPLTVMAPMTFSSTGYTDLSFINEAERIISYPMVIRECFGSFGAQVYLAKNRDEAEAIVKKLNYPFIFQEFIYPCRHSGKKQIGEDGVSLVPASEEDIAKLTESGRDIRLQVVGDRVVAAMLRSNDSDFRANITNGGKMEPYMPSSEEAGLAVSVCRALGLCFAGVDILFSKDGPVLCEVNSNAHFKNISDCTGTDVASSIIEHILKE